MIYAIRVQPEICIGLRKHLDVLDEAAMNPSSGHNFYSFAVPYQQTIKNIFSQEYLKVKYSAWAFIEPFQTVE